MKNIDERGITIRWSVVVEALGEDEGGKDGTPMVEADCTAVAQADSFR